MGCGPSKAGAVLGDGHREAAAGGGSGSSGGGGGGGGVGAVGGGGGDRTAADAAGAIKAGKKEEGVAPVSVSEKDAKVLDVGAPSPSQPLLKPLPVDPVAVSVPSPSNGMLGPPQLSIDSPSRGGIAVAAAAGPDGGADATTSGGTAAGPVPAGHTAAAPTASTASAGAGAAVADDLQGDALSSDAGDRGALSYSGEGSSADDEGALPAISLEQSMRSLMRTATPAVVSSRKLMTLGSSSMGSGGIIREDSGKRFDPRQLAVYSSDASKVVYVAGQDIAVLELATKERDIFCEHTEDVLCLAVHRSGRVASGQAGKNSPVLLWDMETLRLDVALAGHEFGVAAVAWTDSGAVLASVGLDNNHTIMLWDTRVGRHMGNAPRYTGSLGASSKLEAATKFKAAKMETLVVVDFRGKAVTASASGALELWDGLSLVTSVATAHDGPINGLDTNGLHICSGGADGIIKVWDASLQTVVEVNVGHPIRSVCMQDLGHILVQTRSGMIMEVNAKSAALTCLVQAAE